MNLTPRRQDAKPAACWNAMSPNLTPLCAFASLREIVPSASLSVFASLREIVPSPSLSVFASLREIVPSPSFSVFAPLRAPPMCEP